MKHGVLHRAVELPFASQGNVMASGPFPGDEGKTSSPCPALQTPDHALERCKANQVTACCVSRAVLTLLLPKLCLRTSLFFGSAFARSEGGLEILADHPPLGVLTNPLDGHTSGLVLTQKQQSRLNEMCCKAVSTWTGCSAPRTTTTHVSILD